MSQGSRSYIADNYADSLTNLHSEQLTKEKKNYSDKKFLCRSLKLKIQQVTHAVIRVRTMELKSCIQAIIVVIYFILIVQFFRIVNFELDCDDTSDSACISFCSRDKETLPDSFIRNHFHLNETIFSFYDDFEIRRGKPKCLLTKKFVKQSVEVKDEDDFYTALDVSVEFYYFTPHQYCKEKVVGEDGAVKWDTYVCENSESFRLIFNGFGEF